MTASVFPIKRSNAGLHNSAMSHPFLVAPWILFSAYLNGIGWLLSACHQLNAAGYGAAIAAGALLFWLTRSRIDFGRVRWTRFRRVFPFCFLGLACLAILGGILHPPSNYDGLAYRVPRVMHWLSEGRWYWLHTEFYRVNTRATGWEWMAAPLIVFTKSYGGLFLINAVAFCTLPGLVFSLMVQMGVSRPVSWYWMWLIPAGYCFLLQAGSISNDLGGAVFGLSAVVYALKARHSGRFSDVALSILSAALLTSAKAVNIPLLLPWAICCITLIPIVRRKVVSTAAVMLIAAGASIIPMLILNQKFCNDWTGLAVENVSKANPDSLVHVLMNTALLTIQNFVPPVFPMAEAWNKVVQKFVPLGVTKKLESLFEAGGAHFWLPEMQLEEWAGLGCGLSLLLVVSLIAGGCVKKDGLRAQEVLPERLLRMALRLSPWISLFVFMKTSGLTTAARLITPYYGMLIPLLLSGSAQARLVRKAWWRFLALLTFAMALLLLVVSPARPLWPAQTILQYFNAGQSANPMLRRANIVYTTYGARHKGFAPALSALPPGLWKLGLVTFDDPEASLWMPYGVRKIFHVTRSDTLEDFRRSGLEYILANPMRVKTFFSKPLEQWASEHGLVAVQKIPLCLRVGDGAVEWVLLKVPPGPLGIPPTRETSSEGSPVLIGNEGK